MKLNKQLLPFARPCHTGVVPNTFVVFSKGESCLCKESNLEPGQYISKKDRVIFERLLGLMADMGKIIKLGETLPLLFVLIRKCAGGDACVENYRTLTEECQMSVSTIKTWGNKLERLGFIKKENNGPNGLIFKLNDEVIGTSDLFEKIDDQISNATEQIQATMVVAQNSFKQALASVRLLKTGEN